MGNKEGNLVYHCRGYKLKKGFEGLPKQLKDFLMKEKPEFSKAPDTCTKPNETSWTYFKKMKSK